jgi:hypothetical protein
VEDLVVRSDAMPQRQCIIFGILSNICWAGLLCLCVLHDSLPSSLIFVFTIDLCVCDPIFGSHTELQSCWICGRPNPNPEDRGPTYSSVQVDRLDTQALFQSHFTYLISEQNCVHGYVHPCEPWPWLQACMNFNCTC